MEQKKGIALYHQLDGLSPVQASLWLNANFNEAATPGNPTANFIHREHADETGELGVHLEGERVLTNQGRYMLDIVSDNQSAIRHLLRDGGNPTDPVLITKLNDWDVIKGVIQSNNEFKRDGNGIAPCLENSALHHRFVGDGHNVTYRLEIPPVTMANIRAMASNFPDEEQEGIIENFLKHEREIMLPGANAGDDFDVYIDRDNLAAMSTFLKKSSPESNYVKFRAKRGADGEIIGLQLSVSSISGGKVVEDREVFDKFASDSFSR